MTLANSLAPTGALGLTIVRRSAETERLRQIKSEIHLDAPLTRLFLRARAFLPDELAAELFDYLRSIVVISSALRLRVHRLDGSTEDLGLVGTKVVTTAGVNYIVDAFQNTTELENMKYHGIGTGSTAEAVGDTALVTELTTEYNPNSTRATGTTTEGASANIYRTVGTNTLDGTPGANLREHGVFSASSAGTLLDRTVYAAVAIVSGEGLTSTYDLTFTAGS